MPGVFCQGAWRLEVLRGPILTVLPPILQWGLPEASQFPSEPQILKPKVADH